MTYQIAQTSRAGPNDMYTTAWGFCHSISKITKHKNFKVVFTFTKQHGQQ